jgi:transcriptional regulator with XRE-family HTH domain
MIESLPQRLERLMRERGFNQKSLALKAGLNETAVRDILKGRSRRPLHTTVMALAVALDCEVAELLGTARATVPHGMTVIRELDLRATAGGSGSAIEVLQAQESDATRAIYGFPAGSFRETYGADAENVRIVEVIGDSMVPALASGEKVMVNIEDRTPSPPGVFVVWDGMGMVIKRIEYLPGAEPPRVRISSDNPRYVPYERALEEAHILGRIVGRWARV